MLPYYFGNAALGVVHDHHLPRDRKFRQRTEKVWNTAKEENKKLMTAAEFMGYKTVVLYPNI